MECGNIRNQMKFVRINRDWKVQVIKFTENFGRISEGPAIIQFRNLL